LEELLLYLAVFLGSAIPWLEVWIAVPAGVLLGLPVIPAAFTGFLGNVATLLPVVYGGDMIRSRLTQMRKNPEAPQNSKSDESKKSRKQKIIEDYGLPGLAFSGPFLIGVHAAAAFAIAAGAQKKHILIWFSISIAVCSLFFAVLADLGMTNIAPEESLPFGTYP